MRQFLSDLAYAKEVLFHPFDAFYELKYRGKGNVLVALFLFVCFGLTAVLSSEFGGFVVNTVKKSELNAIMIFSSVLLPLVLFVVGNYAVTTLTDGKGRFSEILVVVGYSLIPNIILFLSAIIFSQFITLDELPFYVLMLSIGNIYMLFLIFVGLIVIHEYTFFRNTVSIILSFIAMALIVFILLLMITLFSQVYGFVKIVITELRN